MDRTPEPVQDVNEKTVWSQWFGSAPLRIFVDRPGTRRVRRAGDVLVLILAVLGLAFLGVLAMPPSGFELALARALAAIPDLLDGVWGLAVWLAVLWSAALLGAIVVRRGWGLLRDTVLATGAAILVALVVGRLVGGAWELIWGLALQSGDVAPWAPWLVIVAPVAAITTASPFLTHGFRVLGMWACIAAVAGGLVLSEAPSPVLASASIALVATSSVHLVFGSTRGWPQLEGVARDLEAMGVTANSLALIDRQKAGIFQLRATGAEGEGLTVKVYGRDAADTQFLSTLWKRLSYRGLESQFTTGRLHQVEHEAYMTLLAERAGLSAQQVVIGGLAPSDDAILVLRDLAQAPAPPDWEEVAARGLWRAVNGLQSAGIAHGHIEDDTVIGSGNDVLLKDFRTAVAGPEPWRLTVDQVQAFVLIAIELGPERAVAVARDALGPNRLIALLPMLQPAVVPASSRAALRSRGMDIDDLREETASLLGVDQPELERLRRVTWGSVLKAVLPLVGFFALASVFAGLDLDELANSLGAASWWLVLLGLLFAQVPRIGQAMSNMGASPVPIPLGRLYLLQLAQSFIYLTMPNTAARIAMNVRFLQRHGLPGGTALAVGALDGFTSFLMQASLLLGVLMFSSLTLDLDLDSKLSPGLTTIAVVVVVVVAIAVVVVLGVPRWRRPLLERAKAYLADAREAVRGLGSPRRLGLLLGGTLVAEVLLAATLGVFVVALGHSVGFPELALIYLVAILLGNLLPVPGGIGVVEGGIVVGLARAGLPEEAAFTAAIMFRAATFYLPPILGYAAFRWLTTNKYL